MKKESLEQQRETNCYCSQIAANWIGLIGKLGELTFGEVSGYWLFAIDRRDIPTKERFTIERERECAFIN
jgi:hypothetical protein